jgi:hypothetical protein
LENQAGPSLKQLGGRPLMTDAAIYVWHVNDELVLI